MLTYSEYYNLVKLGLSALEEKLKEASNFTSEQYHLALERENTPETKDTEIKEELDVTEDTLSEE